MGAKAFRVHSYLHFPVQLEVGKPAPFDPAKLEGLYANNESGKGGFYPVGLNQTWHNGIHLTLPRGRTVHAIASGTIVAARLSLDFDKDKYGYGSPRFVLIRHQASVLENPQEKDHDKWKVRDIEYFSLYMHLSTESPSTSDIPWLYGFAPYLGKQADASAAYHRVNGAYDAPPALQQKTGVNVYRKAVKVGTDHYELQEYVATLKPGTVVKKAAKHHGHLWEVSVPIEGCDDVWVDASHNRLKVVPDFGKQVQALNKAECAKLDYPVNLGEAIGHVGPCEQSSTYKMGFFDAHAVHLEVFSAENVIASGDLKDWTVLEDDSDDDAICEVVELLKKAKPSTYEKILHKIEGWFGHAESDVLTNEDIIKRYTSLTPEERNVLRHTITRNTSFWAVDWDKAMSLEDNKAWHEAFHVTEDDQKTAKLYMWWKECEDKGVPLPKRSGGKAMVYHYHPLALMAYIHGHLPELPIFYVARHGQEMVVVGPNDLDISHKEKVFVHEGLIGDWLLGKGLHYVDGVDPSYEWDGIANDGHISLYEALINPANTSGIPALAESDRRIWAAIYKNEGCLDAINSYDAGILSCGPIQQTVGTTREPATSMGELPGALHAVKTAAGAAFQRHFSSAGLDATNITNDPKIALYGDFSIRGTPITSGDDKQEFRRFIWAYMWTTALRDPEFRLPFLKHAFRRLDTLKSLSWKLGTKTIALTDVFKSELGLALLLDAHINKPAVVTGNTQTHHKPIWITAALTYDSTNPQTQINTDEITGEIEIKMLRRLIKLRKEAQVVQANTRSAYIVGCVKDLSDQLAHCLGYSPAPAPGPSDSPAPSATAPLSPAYQKAFIDSMTETTPADRPKNFKPYLKDFLGIGRTS